MVKIVKYFSIFSLVSLLASCASFQSQSTMGISAAPAKDTIQEEISAYDLHKILTSHFGYVRIKLSDTVYALPDNDQVVQLLDPSCEVPNIDNNQKPAHEEGDDFAFAAMVPLRNYAFGAMFVTASNGDRLVINVFVNSRKEIMLWDPQNAQYYRGQINRLELIFI